MIHDLLLISYFHSPIQIIIFNGVENETAEKLRKVLLEEKAKDKLIIIASHIKEDITLLADEVYEMDAGGIG